MTLQADSQPTRTRYTNFYTSADTFLYVEPSSGSKVGDKPIWIDKLETVAFNETVSAAPVYGIGQPIFGFTNLGNIIVSGELSLRFVHEDYFLAAIKKSLALSNVHDNTLITNEIDIDELVGTYDHGVNRQHFINTDAYHLRREKIDSEYANALSESRLLSLPYYFNFRLVFNNENQYHKDTNKTLVIKDVRILSSQVVSSVAATGPVNVKYNFLARMVK